ncbi:30 kDa heat shock protein [Lachnellula willkommii]|uniref:30 kDa heat shock protein n=1 Tax=Lachnellula willkommii TaxID=215461 RepID=A0A559MN02_9HELO|nr:30 kDa heat shock protein [Lachnellula willkommii]
MPPRIPSLGRLLNITSILESARTILAEYIRRAWVMKLSLFLFPRHITDKSSCNHPEQLSEHHFSEQQRTFSHQQPKPQTQPRHATCLSSHDHPSSPWSPSPPSRPSSASSTNSTATTAPRNGNTTGTALKSFQPKFDVKEVESGYELHGELPGIDQKNVEIEFVDPQTLSIRGHVERSYESGEAPAASSGAIKEAGENNSHSHSNSHKATVEDDAKEPATPPSETSKEVQHSSQQQSREQAPASRYWVSERSIGSFSRTFSFPVRVDQDHVKASMKDGILSIVVPKTNEKGSRKITIN